MNLLYFRGPDGDSFAKQNVLHKEEKPPGKTDQPSSSSSSSVLLEVIPPPPSNSFQLEADLRKIGNHPELAYQYLKVGGASYFQTNLIFIRTCIRVVSDALCCYRLVLLQQIHPDAFQTIFQNSLEPDILNTILKILQSFYTK